MMVSFKTKVIVLMTFGIIIIFLITGIVFSITEANHLKSSIVNEANMFVQLTHNRIGDAFIRYHKTGFFRFREIVLRKIHLSSDLENIQIIGVDKRIYYKRSKREKDKFFPLGERQIIIDPFVSQNIKKMEINRKIDKNLIIVAPYINEYGVHSYSIVYTFSLERLDKGLVSLRKNMILMCIGIILVGLVISIIFARRITNHLIHLSNVAKKIASGDFNQLVNIKTNDEFEELAKAFNFMTKEIRNDVRDLKSMVRELKKRDREKTQFLANLSHELRTPLTASLGYVDYMEKRKLGSITSEQAHSLAIIKRNLERLTQEIRSLLDISKYALRSVKLKKTNASISELIEPVLTDFRPDIEMKNLKIKTNYSGNLILYGDKDHLRTVFENIFRNAIKFSPPGGEIQIGITDYSEKRKKYARFQISNQGPSIPRKKLDRIFEPFYQVDRSTKKQYKGIGLGLSIARIIVDAHKGRIWAETKTDITIFNFIIPQGGKYVSR